MAICHPAAADDACTLHGTAAGAAAPSSSQWALQARRANRSTERHSSSRVLPRGLGSPMRSMRSSNLTSQRRSCSGLRRARHRAATSARAMPTESASPGAATSPLHPLRPTACSCVVWGQHPVAVAGSCARVLSQTPSPGRLRFPPPPLLFRPTPSELLSECSMARGPTFSAPRNRSAISCVACSACGPTRSLPAKAPI